MAAILKQVIGHDSVKRAWLDAWGRRHLPHGLLLLGPSGIGKSLLARGFAQTILCETQSGCGQCGPCRRVEQGQNENFLQIEPVAGVIKIEAVRTILKALSLSTWTGPRVVLLFEAHLLNPQAANALLKGLEEPPPETYFILTSSNLYGLLPTIRSRVQVMTCSPLKSSELNRAGHFPAWVLEACQGRLDLAGQLVGEEAASQRALAVQAWQRILQRQAEPFGEEWKDLFKDRETGGFTVQIWQQLLRDGRVRSVGVADLVHRDQMEVIEATAHLPHVTQDRLFELLRELESDLAANVERQLAAENFVLQAQGSLP